MRITSEDWPLTQLTGWWGNLNNVIADEKTSVVVAIIRPMLTRAAVYWPVLLHW